MRVLPRKDEAISIKVLKEDYVRTSRAKGLPERTVNIRHTLRNTLAPNVTLYSLICLNLLGGSVIIESIFNVRGMGQGFIQALNFRDYAYIQATLILVGALVVVINIAADLAYRILDPRITRS